MILYKHFDQIKQFRTDYLFVFKPISTISYLQYLLCTSVFYVLFYFIKSIVFKN